MFCKVTGNDAGKLIFPSYGDVEIAHRLFCYGGMLLSNISCAIYSF